MPVAALRLVLVDDHPVVRHGVAADLGEDFCVVGEAADTAEAIEVITTTRPDLVICDVHMPGGGGIAVVARCAEIAPIVMFTVSDAEQDVLDAVAAGALGYFTKTTTGDELRSALRRAARGEPVFPPELAMLLIGEFRKLARQSTGTNPITPREREVLILVARGHSYRQIGEELYISPKTVENHVRNTLDKLHLTRRDQLIRYAVEHGLE